MPDTFRAFVVNKTDTEFSSAVRDLTLADLPADDVIIQVAYSSVNYKDGLASIPNGQVVRSYPIIPGIDLAGTVVESSDARFRPGDEVIATSYGLGVSHAGGYSQLARVPADWIVPLPAGLTLREAMILGTAGFTAALALRQLERNGAQPEHGPVLVTGATGGVGSVAIALLAQRGYAVTASTGKAEEHGYLRSLGASAIIDRTTLSAESPKPLEKEQWAAAIDAVGGTTLASVLRTTKYGGSVAACGLTGGGAVNTTVFPFILRGVNLLGIDSVQCPMSTRQEIWNHLATDWKPQRLADIVAQEATLDTLPATLDAILHGQARGRTIVKF